MKNSMHNGKKGFFNTLFSNRKNVEEEKTEKLSEDGRNIEVSVVSDVGKIRDNNEDNFFVNIGKYNKKSVKNCYVHYKESAVDGRLVFAVFDGMGGEEHGEKASLLGAATLQTCLRKIRDCSTISDEKMAIDQYVQVANNAICTALKKKKALSGGTTCVIACIDNYRLNAYYLGDSRMYIHRNGCLKMLTKDHTVAFQKYEANIYTEEEARNSRDSHKLTCFMGIDSEKYGLYASSCMGVKLIKGDKVLLCSDGLTDMCIDSEINHILSINNENDAQILINTALKNGGKDNATCVVIKIL